MVDYKYLQQIRYLLNTQPERFIDGVRFKNEILSIDSTFFDTRITKSKEFKNYILKKLKSNEVLTKSEKKRCRGYGKSFLKIMKQYGYITIVDNYRNFRFKIISKLAKFKDYNCLTKNEKKFIQLRIYKTNRSFDSFLASIVKPYRVGLGGSQTKQIKQIDFCSKKVIKIFNSISAARKALKFKSNSSISKALKNNDLTAGGYKWEYV